MTSPSDIWDAFNAEIPNGPTETWTLLRIALSALGIATVLGVTLGVIASRAGRVGALVVTSLGNLGRAVPTIGIMVLVAALWTIGFWPAVVGLVALGVPPILLNTATGLRDVDRGARDAARGMGLTEPQILLRVEMPLATPLILAGVRTAGTETVATAALGGFVGADGLGLLIGAGIGNQQTEILLAGAIAIAVVALALEGCLAGVQQLLTPRGLRLERRIARSQGRLG